MDENEINRQVLKELMETMDKQDRKKIILKPNDQPKE